MRYRKSTYGKIERNGTFLIRPSTWVGRSVDEHEIAVSFQL
jgi:hypothetical protein